MQRSLFVNNFLTFDCIFLNKDLLNWAKYIIDNIYIYIYFIHVRPEQGVRTTKFWIHSSIAIALLNRVPEIGIFDQVTVPWCMRDNNDNNTKNLKFYLELIYNSKLKTFLQFWAVMSRNWTDLKSEEYGIMPLLLVLYCCHALDIREELKLNRVADSKSISKLICSIYSSGSS